MSSELEPTSSSPDWIKRASALLGIFIFTVAIYFVHRMFKQYDWEQIRDALEGLPHQQVVHALIATFASYAVLTLYDVLALNYLGKTTTTLRTLATAFIAFSLTNNVGLANLGGNSVRLRMYSDFGYSPKEILAIIVFISFSFWTGFFGLTGALFLFAPPEIPVSMALSPEWLRILGFFLTLIPVVYFLICLFQWRPSFMKRLRFDLPAWPVAILQIVVSALEWALAALALYFLLPPSSNGGSFLEFLSIFGMAQFLSLLSHVPGGIGVLEATVIYFISPDEQPSASTLGALLAFRMIYYFLPLILALMGWVAYELLKIPKRSNTRKKIKSGDRNSKRRE